MNHMIEEELAELREENARLREAMAKVEHEMISRAVGIENGITGRKILYDWADTLRQAIRAELK